MLTAYATSSYVIGAIWLMFFLLLLLPITRQAVQLFLFQIGAPILAGLLFFLAYLFVYQLEEFSNLMSGVYMREGKIGVFFQMVATLYAIVTGFTLWRAVADFTELDMVLRKEANQINSLSCFLDFFDNVDDTATLTSIKRIRVALKEYCDDVLTLSAVGGSRENESRIRECIACCENLKTPKRMTESLWMG